jgi:hypothetical protein
VRVLLFLLWVVFFKDMRPCAGLISLKKTDALFVIYPQAPISLYLAIYGFILCFKVVFRCFLSYF